jgi:serine/threonine protein kinase/Tol biopolymer transport system component
LSFTPGTRLGPYEVLAKLGEGGMGVVYRATDSNLKRSVAIKVLPASVAGDADRLSRFQREAEVLAALNHPNIGAIYGLEKTPDFTALVMELVEGEDLSQRIARGAMPIAEALPIAKQIAEALEAAHEQGIVHRDLKPANIKVRADGAVKVLDFGLAKAVEAGAAGKAGGAGSLSMSPTITTPAMTQAGMILGTAAYMAPEQARGVAVDKRADIWAFGVVLFELLSGRRLFDGEMVSDTLAAVLRQDIDWTCLPAETPGRIVQLLGRCLERDPKRRMRDIGEARIALDPSSPSLTASAPITAPTPATVAVRRSSAAAWTILALVTVALVAGLVIAQWFRPSLDVPTLRLTTLLPPDVTIDPSTYPILALSRDGSTIAFVGVNNGTSRIYVRRLTEYDAHQLPQTEGATAPFFSPDGAWIGFFGDGKLKKTPTAGGPVVTLAPGSDIRGGVWTSADTIVFSPDATASLQEMPASGGSSRVVTTLDQSKQERTHRWPTMMPDGKTVLFNVGSVAHPNDYDDATIEAVNVETGKRQLVMQGGRMPQYVGATGDLLFVRGKILYAVAVDPQTLQVRGRPRPVLDSVMGDPTTGSAFFAVSNTGTLTYAPGDPSGALRRFAWIDLDGKASSIDLPAALYLDPHVSPDGRRIAFAIVDSTSSDADIWVADPARGTSSRLTNHGVYRSPIWSRDGRRLFCVSYDAKVNRSTIEARAADASGQPEAIGVIDGPAFMNDISTDGSTLYLDASPPTGAAGRSGIYQLSTTGRSDTKPTAFLTSSAGDLAGSAVSPDGRWLAFVSSEAGQRIEVFVQSLQDGGGRMQVSTNGGQNPHWSPDGRTIYYLQGADTLAVSVETSGGLAVGKPRRLFAQQLALQFDSQQYFAVGTDGRLLMMRPNDDRAQTPELRVVLNWVEELKRRAPIK